jgi:hypothetical protein
MDLEMLSRRYLVAINLDLTRGRPAMTNERSL